MPPKSLCSFRIICRKIWSSWEFIHILKKSICLLICKSTIFTIIDSIKLSLSMKSETEIIMNSFSSGNILSPWKLNLISISIYFWRRNNRMKDWFYLICLEILWYMIKGLLNLSCLNSKLIFVFYSKPFCSTIELMTWFKLLFDWRFFYNIYLLSFNVWFFIFENSKIYNTPRYYSSWNNNLPSVLSCSKTLSSEYELFNKNVVDDIIFWHKITRLVWADYKRKVDSANISLFFLFPTKNFPHKIDYNNRNSHDLKFMKIFHSNIKNHLTKCPSKPNKDTTPKSSTKKSNQPKWNQWHTKYSSWNRYEVSNNRNKSTKKCIEILIF